MKLKNLDAVEHPKVTLAEKLIGRKLRKDEVVHHMDRDRKNNDPRNLTVLRLTTHMKLHAQMRRNPTLDQLSWLRDSCRAFRYLGDLYP